MVRLPFQRGHSSESDAIETLEVLLAGSRAGDADARDQLLRSYKPFVDRVVTQVCGRAVSRTEDEFQIAFVAMNEAIDSYNQERGSFIGFAETVMKRRLIDSFRSQGRVQERPFTAFEVEDEDGNTQNIVETDAAVRVFRASEEVAARAEEIARYTQELQLFGIRFTDLVEISPKHQDARENAIAVARLIAGDALLRGSFQKSGTLPLKQLQGRVAVSRKTLERQRNYIVAVVILLVGDYDLLQGFVREGGGR